MGTTTQSDSIVSYSHSVLRKLGGRAQNGPLRPQVLRTIAVIAALAAVALFVFRPGDQASAGVDLADPHAWIEHGLEGELIQVNAASGEVTARLDVADAGNAMSVAAHGDGAAVLDHDTGQLTLVSGSGLDIVSSISLELDEDDEAIDPVLYGSGDANDEVIIVDASQVLIVDPQTSLVSTVSVADPLMSTAQSSSGDFVALSGDGLELLQLGPEGLSPLISLTPPIGGDPAGREVVAAGDELLVLDPARLWAAPLSDEEPVLGSAFCLTSAANGSTMAGSSAHDEPLVVAFNGRSSILALSDATGCRDIPLGITSDDVGRPVVHGQYAYLPDFEAARIHVVDMDQGEEVAVLPFGAPGVPFDLDVIGSTVWANEPQGRFAAVLDGTTIRAVPKIASIVAGAVEEGEDSGSDGEAVTPGALEGSGLRVLGDSGEQVLASGDDGAVIDAGEGGEQQEDLAPDVDQTSTALTAPAGVGIALAAPAPEVAAEVGVEQAALIANFGISSATVTVGEEARFTDFSSGSPTSWTWDFGDGTGAQQPDVEKAWTQPGTYRVSLTVTNLVGDSAVQVTEVTVVPEAVLLPPVADFSFDRNTIEEGEAIVFTSRSTGDVDVLSWEFGDGTTASDEMPTKTYTSSGLYTVTLVATNEAGSSTASTTITVLDGVKAPQAVIAPVPSDIVNGQFVTLRSASLNEPTEFRWDFGDGTRSSGESIRHQWESPGTYRVRLDVSNSKGSDSTFVDVQVAKRVDAPVSQFTQSATEVLVGETITFTSLSLNEPTKLIWDFADGTGSRGERVTKSWSEPGTYRVTLRATNDAGTNRNGVTITVTKPVDRPVASFSVTPSVVILGDPVRVTDTSANEPTTWSWNFGDGSESSQQSTAHVYTEAGTYDIRLEVSNEAGSSSATKEVVVVEKPSANFRWEVTSGSTVKFTDTSWDGPKNWSWDFGDGKSSSGRSPEHTFPGPGRYDVTLVVSNEAGSSEPKTQRVVIAEPVEAVASCEVNGRRLNCTAAGSQNAESYRWSSPGAAVNTNPRGVQTAFAYESGGRYDVTLEVTSADGVTDSVTIRSARISRGLAPRVSDVEVVSVDGDLVRLAATSDRHPDTWEWEFDDATVVNGANTNSPTVRVSRSGDFEGVVRASNPFGTDTDPVEFSVTLPSAQASFSVEVLNSGRIRLINTTEPLPGVAISDVEWSVPGAEEIFREDDDRIVYLYSEDGGTFTAALTITDANGSSRATREIEAPER